MKIHLPAIPNRCTQRLLLRQQPLLRLLPLLVLLLTSTFSGRPMAQDLDRKQKNITAFCKLFGYVRYFHPSDEAQRVEWERFAIYGCRKVLSAPDDSSLITRLRELFTPIAPSVVIFPTGEQPPPSTQTLPSPPDNLKVISWQHLGLGTPFSDYYSPGIYASIRLNRRSKPIPKDTTGYAMLYSTLNPKSYTGHFILKAKMKVLSHENALAFIGLSNLYSNGQTTDTSNYTLSDKPATDSTWKQYQLEGNISPSAVSVVVGLTLKGKGDLYLKDLSLTIRRNGQSVAVPFNNDWQNLPYNNYSYQSVNNADPERTPLISYIRGNPLPPIATPLYDRQHAAGDHIQKELVPKISCFVPLALYGTDKFTLPRADTALLNDLLRKEIAATNGTITADSLDVRLTDIVLAFTVYRHFFPFWHEASRTPDELLSAALKKSFTDTSPYEFFQTLLLMSTPLNDGHIFVTYARDSSASASAPLTFDRVGDNIVVRYLLDTTLRRQLKKGDIVDSIGNKPALEALQEAESHISGSPQWKNFKGLLELANGYTNSSLRLVIDKNPRRSQVLIPRTAQGLGYRNGGFSDHPLPSGPIGKDRYYINLFDTVDRVTPLLPQLTEAKAIIFDLRGYPSTDIFTTLLPHLLNKAGQRRNILHGPQILYPDYEDVTFQDYDDVFQPAPPHFKGKIYILSDASAGSVSENFLSYIKVLKLGTIIGQPSAGTNGNINVIYLPGDYSMSFTGMLVSNPDGNGSHLQGIIPDIMVQHTLNGIKNGKDEILDAAIRIAAQ